MTTVEVGRLRRERGHFVVCFRLAQMQVVGFAVASPRVSARVLHRLRGVTACLRRARIRPLGELLERR
jgi:hypothetical protein